MASSSKVTTLLTNPWIVAGVIVIVVELLLSLTSFGSLIRAAVVVGPDRSSAYAPLVRSQQSLDHRYDSGTDACEKNATQTKEFTLAYLFKSPPRGLKAKTVYGCYQALTPQCAKNVTTVAAECKAQGLASFALGFVATTPDFEAPVPVIKCTNASAKDALITNDVKECEQAGYSNPIQLGYAATAGYLPSRNLDGLCSVVNQQAACATKKSPLCNAYVTFCKQDILTPSPTPAPTPPF